MQFFVQHSELRDLYDKVAAGERISEADALRQGLEAMGPINALAVEEHAEETKRLDHLTTQRDDIVAAKSSLSQSIRELDVVARERFIATFGSARENFRHVFDTLFGGVLMHFQDDYATLEGYVPGPQLQQPQA